jgi:hypothetical protein
MKLRNSVGRVLLMVFSLGALCDFVWSYVRRRSIAEGAISAVLGLFGTAWYVLLLQPGWKDTPKSLASRDEPGRQIS